MNEGDIASKYEQHVIENALANREKFEGESLEECVLCGNDIPEERRKTGGVTHCVDCKARIENRSKHYR